MAMLRPDDGFQVVADAANGRELIALIKTLDVPPDVCLIDINMPEMNGYDTIKALKVEYPDMRFLVLTQFEDQFIIIRMLRLGAGGYLLKDTDATELMHAIRTIMEETYYHNARVNGPLFNHARSGKHFTKHNLSDREQEFLRLCCSELTYAQIASEMNIAERTVAFYRQTLFEKLETKSRTGLALLALRYGLTSIDDKQ
jgi:DNA-binding NarL/FixJ family response regulator